MPDLPPLLQQALVAAPAALAIVLGTVALNMLVGRALRFVADRANVDHEAFSPIGRLLRWVVNVAAVVLLLGMLGWDRYDKPVEIITGYFPSSGTGQLNAVFPLP